MNLSIYFLFLFSIIQNNEPLSGSKWKLQVTPATADTLAFVSNDKAYHYSCEMKDNIDIVYAVHGDTLLLDEYESISMDDPTSGKEIVSKLKLVIIGDKLKPVYIAHKYADKFIEVDPKIYAKFGEFERVK